MKEFNKDVKKIIWLVVGLFVLFLAIRYWAVIEGMVTLGIDAATPLLIGCVMAYVINILLNFYEKWYDRIFKLRNAKMIHTIRFTFFATSTLKILSYHFS